MRRRKTTKLGLSTFTQLMTLFISLIDNLSITLITHPKLICSLSHSDYQAKEKALRKLREKVLDKNQDEFYFHMINSKVVNGRHYENRTDECTPEQLKLMQTQDLNYIEMKRKMEIEKIDKLKNQSLHLINLPVDPAASTAQREHIIFIEEGEDVTKRLSALDTCISKTPSKRQLKVYKELTRRQERLKQLDLIIAKIRGKKAEETKSKIRERQR